MTGQLEFPTSPPTWCWVCRAMREIKPAGCGPQCEEEQ